MQCPRTQALAVTIRTNQTLMVITVLVIARTMKRNRSIGVTHFHMKHVRYAKSLTSVPVGFRW